MSGTKRATPGRRDSEGREIRIAAIGDLHFSGEGGALANLFARVQSAADIFVLCGDLTTHGRPEQMRALAAELKSVEIPMVAVLGNHDHEMEAGEELTAILHDAGVTVLNGDYVVIDGIGFAGVKGFAGGFGRGALAPFGERLIKEFVQAAIEDALKLENALRSLTTDVKVAVLHYSPIEETLRGEPEIIYPFLGSSRLLQPIDTIGASVVFHGHAHHGSREGRTPAGIPVYNVSYPLLRATSDEEFMVWTARAPDRRREQRPEEAVAD